MKAITSNIIDNIITCIFVLFLSLFYLFFVFISNIVVSFDSYLDRFPLSLIVDIGASEQIGIHLRDRSPPSGHHASVLSARWQVQTGLLLNYIYLGPENTADDR